MFLCHRFPFVSSVHSPLSVQPPGVGGGGEVPAGAAADVSLLWQEVCNQEAFTGSKTGDQPVLCPLPAPLELE